MDNKKERFEWRFAQARRALYKICFADLNHDCHSVAWNAEYGLSLSDPESGNASELGRECLRNIHGPVRVLDYWAAQHAALMVSDKGTGGYQNTVFYNPNKFTK